MLSESESHWGGGCRKSRGYNCSWVAMGSHLFVFTGTVPAMQECHNVAALVHNLQQ